MQKVANSRNQEERKKVEAFWTQGTELIASAFFDTALYAVAYPNGQQVAVGGADGVIQVLVLIGSFDPAFVPVPLEDTDSDALYTLSVSPSNSISPIRINRRSWSFRAGLHRVNRWI